MSQLLPVAVTNDPRNNSSFANVNRIYDGIFPTVATASSFASFTVPWYRGVILDFGADMSIESITAWLNTAGTKGFGGWRLQWATAAAPTAWTTITGSQGPVLPNGYRTYTFTAPVVARYIALGQNQVAGAYKAWLQIDDSWGDGDALPTPPDPPTPPPVTFVINGVQFDRLKKKRFRVVHNNHGEGFFVIDRHDVQATSDNLFKGALVECIFPSIDPLPLVEFTIETGDFDLIESDEEGAEELRFGGPGTLAYLRRAIMDAVQYEGVRQECFPAKNYWQWENSAGNRTEGDIIKRLIEEAQSPSRPSDPIPFVTRTFNDDHDSNFVDWDLEAFEGVWHTPILANVYDEVIRLAEAGLLSVDMDPGYVMNAYRNMGDDHTGTAFGAGVVRFVKGVNIADEVGKSVAYPIAANHAIGQKPNGEYFRAEASGSFPFDSEVAVESRSDNDATAVRDAKGQLGLREDAQEALIFAQLSPSELWDQPVDEAAGIYLPGKPWTENGKYWVGDLVTLHTGTSELDYDNQTFRVYAITLMEDEVGDLALPIVELNAPYLQSGESGLTSTTPGTTAPVPSTSGSTTSGGGGGGTPTGAYQPLAAKDQPDGYAGLDEDGLLDADQQGTSKADNDVLTYDAGLGHAVWETPASALVVMDEGTPLATAAQRLDFVGAGVVASGTGVDKTLTIPGTPTGAAGGDLSGTYPNPSVVNDSHDHTAATITGVIESGDAAGGDLSGTYPNPSVVNDSHAHTLATLPTEDSGIEFVIDGGGSVISTGAKGFLKVPFACTIVESEIEADVSTTTTLTIKKRAFGGGAAASIVAAALPTLSAATEAKDSTLTGWTTALAAGAKLYWEVTTNNNATKITSALTVRRT